MRCDRTCLRTLLTDGALAVLLGLLSVAVTPRQAMWQERLPVDETGYVLMVLAAAMVTLRRVWPMGTFAVVVSVLAVYLALGYPWGPPLLTVAVAMYTVASRRGLRQSLPAVLAGILVLSIHLCFEPPGSGFGLPSLNDSVEGLFAVTWLLLPWALGTTVRMSREGRKREREEETRERLYAERLRIAQEVHDVVGHGLAAIAMQADVALHVLDKRPEHARTALREISRTSKEALDELRATLAVFRAAEQRRPAPGLDQLDALVSRMSSSGVPVTVTVIGDRPEVPATVDLAGYRIVQESLTNVLRHAGRATAAVGVDYQPDQVTVEVTDTGLARPGDTPRPGGHGIDGMRERAAAVGGTLVAGPRPEGGYAVVARLPLREARS